MPVLVLEGNSEAAQNLGDLVKGQMERYHQYDRLHLKAVKEGGRRTQFWIN